MQTVDNTQPANDKVAVHKKMEKDTPSIMGTPHWRSHSSTRGLSLPGSYLDADLLNANITPSPTFKVAVPKKTEKETASTLGNPYWKSYSSTRGLSYSSSYFDTELSNADNTQTPTIDSAVHKKMEKIIASTKESEVSKAHEPAGKLDFLRQNYLWEKEKERKHDEEMELFSQSYLQEREKERAEDGERDLVFQNYLREKEEKREHDEEMEFFRKNYLQAREEERAEDEQRDILFQSYLRKMEERKDPDQEIEIFRQSYLQEREMERAEDEQYDILFWSYLQEQGGLKGYDPMEEVNNLDSIRITRHLAAAGNWSS